MAFVINHCGSHKTVSLCHAFTARPSTTRLMWCATDQAYIENSFFQIIIVIKTLS